MIQLEDIFRLLQDSVRFAPTAEKAYEQLQTFAVLQEVGNINLENLGKNIYDKGKPFFYSRRWEALNFHSSKVAFSYPALFVFEQQIIHKDLFQKQQKCYDIQLSCLYPDVENSADTELKRHCPQLLINEIYLLTERLLEQAILYLKEVVYATTSSHPQPQWYHRQQLEFAQANGIITSYQEDRPASRSFSLALRQNNESITGMRHERLGKDNLYGTSINLTLCTKECEEADYNFTTQNCCTAWDDSTIN